MGWKQIQDDRGLLTLLLEPGEFTQPLALQPPDSDWHISCSQLPAEKKELAKDLIDDALLYLDGIHVTYYKAHSWLPALRLEMPRSVADNKNRLATVLQGIKHQCATPAVLEPYPLYIADRTVKALSQALPAFRHVTTQRIAEDYVGDIGEVYFAMHGYRSESGR